MPKDKEPELEKFPLLIIYKQGDKLVAHQPEEIIDEYQFWAFLKIYTESYGDRLKEGLEGF